MECRVLSGLSHPFSWRLRIFEFGNPKIEHFDKVRILPALDQKNIFRLQVPMDNAFGMRCTEGITYLLHDSNYFGHRLGSICIDILPPISSIEKLKHHEDRAVVKATHIRDFNNILLTNTGRCERLAMKTSNDLRILCELTVKAFDRHPALDEHMLTFIHRTHSPFAQLTNNSVPLLQNHSDFGIWGFTRLQKTLCH